MTKWMQEIVSFDVGYAQIWGGFVIRHIGFELTVLERSG